MRKPLVATVLVTLLAALTIGAAPATTMPGPSRMPANYVLIMQALRHRGIIPLNASLADAQLILQRYLHRTRGAKPEDRPFDGFRLPASVSSGNLTPWGRVVASTSGQTVDRCLVILVSFSTSDYTDPGFPGVTFPGGPRAGQIGPPAVGDNHTFWPGVFSAQHYANMLFGNAFAVYGKKNGKLYSRGISHDTMKSYYLEMSKGKYLVSGTVAPWIKLDKPESWYGMNTPPNSGNGSDDYTGPVWRVARDAVAKLAQVQPHFPWALYDQKNPVGIKPGSVNQPDGFIDHLIIIHAGVGEEAGGGVQGPNAIWSHSWAIADSPKGGPGENPGYLIPGTKDAGHPNGIWAGPYTCNPEDGGIGVFCHEFGHDLGLPDEYDTTYYGESPSGFWTVMDQGSWAGRQWGLGTRPTAMDAWDKAQLGFIKPITINQGPRKIVTLQPAATGAAGSVAFKIVLPSSHHIITLDGVGTNPDAPALWSYYGNNLKNSLITKNEIDVPAAPVTTTLTFSTWYEIEDGYDFGYVRAKDMDTPGAAWEYLQNADTVSDGGSGYGFTGSQTTWTNESFDLSAYAGKHIELQFLYKSDVGFALRGWQIDTIAVTTSVPSTLLTCDGTSADAAAKFDFSPASGAWRGNVNGAYSGFWPRYYIAEYRNWSGFDGALANAYQSVSPAKVGWYQYRPGLLLLLVDDFYQDNDYGLHPGAGHVMVVDAHANPEIRLPYTDAPIDSSYDMERFAVPLPWGNMIQSRDSAFSRSATPTQIIASKYLLGHAAAASFNDDRFFFFPFRPVTPYDLEHSVGTIVPHLGVQFSVRGFDKHGNLPVLVANPQPK